ncbi:MAG: hypothetical protein F4118_00320 [Acidimicrobiaceae bacterium]|nr:hypothetical protein [Candidatus Poribacteria bacterium]MYI34866.1 hypothetical protein [Acidimicrobiaceae bacterium]
MKKKRRKRIKLPLQTVQTYVVAEGEINRKGVLSPYTLWVDLNDYTININITPKPFAEIYLSAKGAGGVIDLLQSVGYNKIPEILLKWCGQSASAIKFLNNMHKDQNSVQSMLEPERDWVFTATDEEIEIAVKKHLDRSLIEITLRMFLHMRGLGRDNQVGIQESVTTDASSDIFNLDLKGKS